MFEPSLYQQVRVPTPPDDIDLFKDYEIKPWEKSGRLYRILGISAIGNILAILVIAQASLLTTKGCDSPLVGRVCSVLDVVYVSSLLFGTDREYVDAAYDDTKIGDSEVTFVDVSSAEPKFRYPADYDKYANPEKFAAQQTALDPLTGLPLNNNMADIDLGAIQTFPSTGNLLDTPPVLPPSNPNVITGNLPSFNSGSTPTYKPPRRGKSPRVRNPSMLPDIDDNAVAQVKPSPTPTPTPELPKAMTSEEIQATVINKKPLVDFADQVAVKWETKEVDLNQPFTVVLNGVFAADGSLDVKASKFDPAKRKGDPKMIEIGEAALQALGQSGYLIYLKNLNVDRFVATLVQDDEQITVLITSNQKTPEAAKSIASGLGLAISVGKQVTQDPSDERTLLNSAKVTADGKNFILNFAIPKPIAQEMINRKLKDASAKKATQVKPSGTNPIKTLDKTALQ